MASILYHVDTQRRLDIPYHQSATYSSYGISIYRLNTPTARRE